MSGSEGLFVVARAGVAVPDGPGGATFVLGDGHGGPPQAGGDLVGGDLHFRVLVALGVFPAALVEAACDHDPVAPLEALCDVLGQVGPGDHVEEGRGLFPFLGLAVLPPAVDGDAEGGVGLAGGGEAEFGVPGQRCRRW